MTAHRPGAGTEVPPDHHAVVWIDHHFAEITRFDRHASTFELIHHRDAPHTIHHKAGTPGPGHVAEDAPYLAEVTQALRPVREILIIGPGQVKSQLQSYIERHAPDVAKRILGVEAADRLTPGEVLDHARRYFVRKDRMLPQ